MLGDRFSELVFKVHAAIEFFVVRAIDPLKFLSCSMLRSCRLPSLRRCVPEKPEKPGSDATYRQLCEVQWYLDYL